MKNALEGQVVENLPLYVGLLHPPFVFCLFTIFALYSLSMTGHSIPWSSTVCTQSGAIVQVGCKGHEISIFIRNSANFPQKFLVCTGSFHAVLRAVTWVGGQGVSG